MSINSVVRATKLDKIFGTPVCAVLLAILCNILWYNDNLCIVTVCIRTLHSTCHFIRKCHTIPYTVDCLTIQLHNFVIPVNFNKFHIYTDAVCKSGCHLCIKTNPLSIVILVIHWSKISDTNN